ncbi:DUF389 domain-containing protein [Algivirga pacifica]|uniref:DUF389 domain-containing protein n=1 Tax=Algivirga pacifica TaxID=1162670 RepID=A0ABP9DB90_9BACT
MANEENPNKKSRLERKVIEDPTKIEDKSVRSIWQRILDEIRESFELTQNVDYEATIKSIEGSVKYRGYNIWVLMCSIVVASVGLNNNSPAVIIGAMLISPLMGPIRGIGLGLGLIDFGLIAISLKNFLKMTIVSLMVSFLYFLISPIERETPELLNRTFPTTLDILVAFFGGLAGIIAATRGERGTVVPGVAIATALMPPLCTAGYGMASAKWSYFFGAMYLFLLNSLFICISTVGIIRLMKFPTRQFIDPKVEKKVKNYLLLGTVIIIIPSGILFYRLVKESLFLNNSENFYLEVIKPSVTDENIKLNFNSKYINPDSTYMELDVTHGSIDDRTIATWKNQTQRYHLEQTTFRIFHRQFRFRDFQHIDSLIQQVPESEKGDALVFYRNQVDSLETLLKQKEIDQWNISPLKEGLRIDYPDLQKMAFGKEITEDIQLHRDTLYILTLHWKRKLSRQELKVIRMNIRLKTMLHLQQNGIYPDSLVIKIK